jgi:hypothetical protein
MNGSPSVFSSASCECLLDLNSTTYGHTRVFGRCSHLRVRRSVSFELLLRKCDATQILVVKREMAHRKLLRRAILIPSRDDKTAIELFLDGVADWSEEICHYLTRIPTGANASRLVY